MTATLNRGRKSKRALLEKLWAEDVPTAEIAAAMGWSPKQPAATYIAIYRARGYNLPHRRDEDEVRLARQGRWG